MERGVRKHSKKLMHFILLIAILQYSTQGWFTSKLRSVWRIFCPPSWCWDASHVPLKHSKNLSNLRFSLERKKKKDWYGISKDLIWSNGLCLRLCRTCIRCMLERLCKRSVYIRVWIRHWCSTSEWHHGCNTVSPDLLHANRWLLLQMPFFILL